MADLSEAAVRLIAFAGIFAAMALGERLIPRRAAHPARGARWFTNLGMLIVDSLVLRVVFPAAAVGVALYAQMRGIGLFNALEIAPIIAGAVSVVVLDLAIWAAHVASHKWPWLWRVHKVHHSDVDLDVTSALRFHPVEILISMAWKGVVVLALGAPPLAVLVFEIILNGAAMFNHANLRLPLSLDRVLRYVVVTPDMHRIHHSVHMRETDSNYGFNLAIWDRLFGTYTEEPQDGQTGMTIGLSQYQSPAPTRLLWSLALPFRRAERNAAEGQGSTGGSQPENGSTGKAR
ncbi:MAG: sterol desaturase family protein [Hyphomicrobiaceae bacterium]|nr:sterol desaturase family protein [Hyphomicrobiaceae bacterium]